MHGTCYTQVQDGVFLHPNQAPNLVIPTRVKPRGGIRLLVYPLSVVMRNDVLHMLRLVGMTGMVLHLVGMTCKEVGPVAKFKKLTENA